MPTFRPTFLAALLCGCAPLPDAYEGVQLRFDPASATPGDGFFAAPFPMDERLGDDGRMPIVDLPGARNLPLLEGLAETASEHRVSQIPVIWFGLRGALGELNPDRPIHGEDAPILLVDVDPASAERGRRVPVVASVVRSDAYAPVPLLAVSPVPGFVLRPATTYAAIVLRELGDADGELLGTPAEVLAGLRGRARDARDWPERVEAWSGLRDALPELDLTPDDVAGAAVFTTGDVVADVFELTEAVRQAHPVVIEGLAIAEQRGGSWPRYCELHGTVRMPQFQRGEPLFNTEGLFEFGGDGLPVVQRYDDLPVVITVPREPMPEAGYPLAMYFHGSGGRSDQLVLRGPVTRSGELAEGEGPAFVLAGQGFAAAGIAHPVNPERVPGATAIAYLNFANLKAFRDTFRQGIIEQRLYLDALLDLRIPSAALEGCEGVSLPSGGSAYRFDEASVVAMGQSMGGMYTNLVGAVDPRIQAVVPTGAGGHWSRFILITELLARQGLDATALLGNLLGLDEGFTWMHPALHIAQLAWEPAEPMVYLPRLAEDPLPGHPVRPIYQPVGEGDSYFPPPIFDAFALAYGNDQAGEEVWPSMQRRLALAEGGGAGLLSYPVSHNRVALDGTPYTGVVVQYAGDGFTDPHVIFTQFPEVKAQYACFFGSWLRAGVAEVVAGDGCDW